MKRKRWLLMAGRLMRDEYAPSKRRCGEAHALLLSNVPGQADSVMSEWFDLSWGRRPFFKLNFKLK